VSVQLIYSLYWVYLPIQKTQTGMKKLIIGTSLILGLCINGIGQNNVIVDETSGQLFVLESQEVILVEGENVIVSMNQSGGITVSKADGEVIGSAYRFGGQGSDQSHNSIARFGGRGSDESHNAAFAFGGTGSDESHNAAFAFGGTGSDQSHNAIVVGVQ